VLDLIYALLHLQSVDERQVFSDTMDLGDPDCESEETETQLENETDAGQRQGSLVDSIRSIRVLI